MDSGIGLYVSTGGFTKDARLEVQQAARPIHLMNLVQLVMAIVERYESADGETDETATALEESACRHSVLQKNLVRAQRGYTGLR